MQENTSSLKIIVLSILFFFVLLGGGSYYYFVVLNDSNSSNDVKVSFEDNYTSTTTEETTQTKLNLNPLKIDTGVTYYSLSNKGQFNIVYTKDNNNPTFFDLGTYSRSSSTFALPKDTAGILYSDKGQTLSIVNGNVAKLYDLKGVKKAELNNITSINPLFDESFLYTGFNGGSCEISEYSSSGQIIPLYKLPSNNVCFAYKISPKYYAYATDNGLLIYDNIEKKFLDGYKPIDFYDETLNFSFNNDIDGGLTIVNNKDGASTKLNDNIMAGSCVPKNATQYVCIKQDINGSSLVLLNTDTYLYDTLYDFNDGINNVAIDSFTISDDNKKLLYADTNKNLYYIDISSAFNAQ